MRQTNSSDKPSMLVNNTANAHNGRKCTAPKPLAGTLNLAVPDHLATTLLGRMYNLWEYPFGYTFGALAQHLQRKITLT